MYFLSFPCNSVSYFHSTLHRIQLVNLALHSYGPPCIVFLSCQLLLQIPDKKMYNECSCRWMEHGIYHSARFLLKSHPVVLLLAFLGRWFWCFFFFLFCFFVWLCSSLIRSTCTFTFVCGLIHCFHFCEVSVCTVITLSGRVRWEPFYLHFRNLWRL